jgi:predicted metalloprotease with PDZ domain
MREMWRSYGATEVPYVVSDIEAALGRVTGDDAFAADFFDRYVRGREAPDYPALLAGAGIAVEPARPEAAWLGNPPLRFDDDGAVLLATPLLDTPLYDAGVDRGDRIVAIDGTAPASADAVARLLSAHGPGDAVSIRYESRGGVYEETVSLPADPALVGRWIPADSVGPSEAALRAAWR